MLNDELNLFIKKMTENQDGQPDIKDQSALIDGQATTEPVAPTTPSKGDDVAATTAPANPVAPQKPTDDGLIEDWDAVTAPAATPDTPQSTPTKDFDFSFIANALSNENIKTKEDVEHAVAELKRVAETYKNVPKDLEAAIEIAKSNGNYLEYLQVGVVDWSKEDPIVLYENYIEDQFYNPETNLVDYEKVDKILEKLDDDEKELRGKELQKQYVSYQKQQRDFMEAKARADKAAFEDSVRKTVNDLNDINGYKLTPSKRSELISYVLSGEDLRENDVRSRVVNAFIKKNFNTLDSYMKTKVRNSTQREILSEAQIPDIKPSDAPVSPQTTKAYSISDYIADLAKQKGL